MLKHKEQTNLPLEGGKDLVEEQTRVRHHCKYHRYVKQEDFIEVVIKKTGEKALRCRYCELEKQEMRKIRSTEWKKESDEVSDYYVRRTLATGKGALKMNEYPDELVSAKQAVIKLNRAVKKANEPYKTCSTHGKLYRDDVIKAGTERSGSQKWKCKQCMKDLHKRHYELNKTKVLLAHQTYKKKNPEKVKQTKSASNKLHRHKYRERENHRKKIAERVHNAELSDRYVKKLIVKRTTLSMADVPPAMIDCVRAIQKLKRSIRSKTKESKISTLEKKINGED